jgi:soluble P-type ATPase
VQPRSFKQGPGAELQSIAQGRGATLVCVSVNDRFVGGLLMADNIRVEAPTVLRRLFDAGIRKIVLLTGDDPRHAEGVAAALGLKEFRSRLQPRDKTAAVEEEKTRGRVIMVGDGVNDAPALAAADVGVAMGVRGAAASAEAANIVLLVDRLDRLVTARRIAERSIAIARQSAFAGMALSCVAMAAAVAGYLSPVQGALLQELIDIAVILNALRALGDSFRWPGRHRALAPAELIRLEDEHRMMADVVDKTMTLADEIPELPSDELLQRLTALDRLLSDSLLQHEERDEQEIFSSAPRQPALGAGVYRDEPDALGNPAPRARVRRLVAIIVHQYRRKRASRNPEIAGWPGGHRHPPLRGGGRDLQAAGSGLRQL